MEKTRSDFVPTAQTPGAIGASVLSPFGRTIGWSALMFLIVTVKGTPSAADAEVAARVMLFAMRAALEYLSM